MQLTKINSIPLLKELIAYNREGNFDRCIAFFLCILQDTEMHKISVDEANKEVIIDNFFNRDFFTNKRNNGNNLADFIKSFNNNEASL